MPTFTAPSRSPLLLVVLMSVLAACGTAGTATDPATSPHTASKRASTAAVRSDDDGTLPGDATIFDDGYAAIARLDRPLRRALRSAAKAARRDGVTFVVNSGWRSPAYQERLLDRAVETYGSRAEAARWVATPETSPHVSGDAVDLGWAAARWVADKGARYGLCRVYRNEPWHVELRPSAVTDGCPPMYADPSVDPRLQS
jgi:zinc D-Ala-D-Ala carboxypeptidase